MYITHKFKFSSQKNVLKLHKFKNAKSFKRVYKKMYHFTRVLILIALIKNAIF